MGCRRVRAATVVCPCPASVAAGSFRVRVRGSWPSNTFEFSKAIPSPCPHQAQPVSSFFKPSWTIFVCEHRTVVVFFFASNSMRNRNQFRGQACPGEYSTVAFPAQPDILRSRAFHVKLKDECVSISWFCCATHGFPVSLPGQTRGSKRNTKLRLDSKTGFSYRDHLQVRCDETAPLTPSNMCCPLFCSISCLCFGHM